MGLEVSAYISGLTASWPTAGEPKSQGDDHIRLIKGALQGTFPNATGPLYFPKGENTATTMVLDITDQNNVITVTTTSGDIAITLPAGFTTTNAGWSCEIMKSSADANAAVVSPASGTITSRVGATATIRIGSFAEPARFIWTGATWVCVKPGPLIGSTINWDGDTVPYGYMLLNGAAYNTTTYAELYAAYGYATLVDKRGRAELGAGTGGGLTTRAIRITYGLESFTLALTNLPNHLHTGTTNTTGSHAHTGGAAMAGVIGDGAHVYGPYSYCSTPDTGTAGSHAHTMTTDALSGANATAVGLLQPSIATQKIIRAC